MKHSKTGPLTHRRPAAARAALALSLALCVPHLCPAAPFELDLTGTLSYDGWTDLTSPTYSAGGLMFPGTGAWGTTGNWSTYDPDGAGPGTAVGAIGSNTAGSGDALLYKISNGAGGGPYPASGSIYFGGFSGDANVNGGTLGVVDTTPLTGLKTVAFQVDIGEATGYDFFNNQLPILKYQTAASGDTWLDISPTQSALLLQLYTGDIMMPTGYEDLYRNTWGLQYDFSGITDTITALQFSFTGVQHAQLYALQLDQSTDKYTTSVFATGATWDAGGTTSLWSEAANWNNDTTPEAGKAVDFSTGTGVVLDSSRTIQGLTLNAATGFTLSAQPGAVLTIGESGIKAEGATPASHVISAPVEFSTPLNIVSVADGQDLTLSGGLTAPGFYKSGPGTLRLAGNNAFSSNSQGRIIMNGGEMHLTGTSAYTGTGTMEFEVKSGTLHLTGGNDRLSSQFSLDLVSRRVTTDGVTVQEDSGHLVLGDATGKVNQTLAGLKADASVLFETTGALTTTDAVSAASVTGGHATTSTLSVDVAAGSTFTYMGSLGGAGVHDNQLAFVKQGAGTQVLGGVATYGGDTVVEGGVLRLASATALSSASHLRLAGGILELAGGDFTRSLGTGAGQVQLVGGAGFSAYGALRKVNLGGAGATVAWGQTGFLGDGEKLVLSSTVSNHTVEFENALDLGSATRTVHVHNGSATVDARLTGAVEGAGTLEKTGTGTLESTAANTHTGGSVVKEGTFALAGADGSVDGGVKVLAGATLRLTNTETASHADRLEDSATVQMQGAVLNFSNPTTGTAPASSETIGGLELERGANTITTSRTADGGTAALTLGSLTRNNGATVNFNGASLGVDARNQVRFSTAPTLDDGLLGGWATAGNEWATYGANGVTALAAYATGAESSWAASQNVKVFGAVTTTLTGDRVVNSLNLVGATTGSVGHVLHLGGQTLRVESGGILTSAGGSSRKTVIRQGNLTAGTGAHMDAELFVVANGTTDIEATITDNGTGSVSLVKAGTGTLTITANNDYSGDTIVNQGTLNLNGQHTGGAGLIVRKGANLNVAGSIEVGGKLQIDGFMWGAGNINIAAGTMLTGSGNTENSFSVGAGPGKIAVLAPGNSPGTLTTGSQTWTTGGTYLWEINGTGVSSSTMGQDPGWDLLLINGTLDLTSLTTGSFDIDLTTLTPENEAGLLAGFDLMADYAWTIVTATGGISGFEESDFHLYASAFINDYTGGSFSLSHSGNSLVLNYAGAVPEPDRAMLLLAGLLGLVFRRRRPAARTATA